LSFRKATVFSDTKLQKIQDSGGDFVGTLNNHDDADSLLLELIEILQSVDPNAPLAKLNETSISDNQGGRIEL
jgi:hypothetical protein